MTRRLLGWISFLTTLFGSGCLVAPTTNPPMPSPTALNKSDRPDRPIDRTKNGTEPNKLPDELVQNSPSKIETTSNRKLEQFTQQPGLPLPQRKIDVGNPPPRNPEPPVVAAPKHPIVVALECMLDNQPQLAPYHLKEYDARTQEFVLRALPLLSLVSKKTLTPAEVAAIYEQIEALRFVYLKDYTDFTLPNVCFCEWIKGYANYKPLPPEYEFVASQPDRPGELVQLYVGLRNFGTQPNQGGFETKLASHVEIRDQQGQIKWSHHFRADDLTLVSQTRLAEYYHNFTFTLPPSLPPGNYSLVVQMTDQTQPATPRTARSSVPLRISTPKD